MGRLMSLRPSPTIIVAIVALVAAAAGTAVAGPTASTSKLTKSKVRSIADKEIQKLASGLSVASANTANTANTANSANSANSANTAITANTAAQLTSVTVQREDFTVADGANNGTTAACPAGQQAIAGGVRSDDFDIDGFVTTSRPVNPGGGIPNDGESFDGWRAFVTNFTGGGNTLQASVWVICAG